MYQREAMWISFCTPCTCAVKVSLGSINALTGAVKSEEPQGIRKDLPQDYLALPNQPWLDGFCTEQDIVRQVELVSHV